MFSLIYIHQYVFWKGYIESTARISRFSWKCILVFKVTPLLYLTPVTGYYISVFLKFLFYWETIVYMASPFDSFAARISLICENIMDTYFIVQHIIALLYIRYSRLLSISEKAWKRQINESQAYISILFFILHEKYSTLFECYTLIFKDINALSSHLPISKTEIFFLIVSGAYNTTAVQLDNIILLFIKLKVAALC